MLATIEDEALKRIRSKWPQGLGKIAEFDISNQVDGIICPGISIAAECIGFTKSRKDVWLKKVVVHVYLVFKDLRGSGKKLREGAHLIVSAVENILCGQTLGLEIEQLLPKASPEITDDELRLAQRIAFRVDFETNFEIEKMTDEQVSELLAIGVNYFLMPGDSTPDASDELTLEE
jgi:hypothetical protein